MHVGLVVVLIIGWPIMTDTNCVLAMVDARLIMVNPRFILVNTRLIIVNVGHIMFNARLMRRVATEMKRRFLRRADEPAGTDAARPEGDRGDVVRVVTDGERVAVEG
jgi:hypothetical protein